MTLAQKILSALFIVIIAISLFLVVLKPVITSKYISVAKNMHGVNTPARLIIKATMLQSFIK